MVVNNKLLALVCALFISGTLIAQELRRIEYFFDADPGYGSGVSIDGIKEGQNTCQIDFSSLEAGVHIFNIRAQDSKANWSSVWSRAIYVYNLHGFSRVEYFIDTDPGVGSAISVGPVAGNKSEQTIVFDVDLSNLELGEHYLCVRGMDIFGQWTDLSKKMFTICEVLEPEEPVGDLARLEYFFDNDPGYGKGKNVQRLREGEGKYLLSLDGLEAGVHNFNLRAQDVRGNWSAVWSRALYVYSLQNVEKVEYFVDEDPGEGNATSVGVFASGESEKEIAFNVDLEGVGVGDHYLCVRAMDALGQWSTVSKEPFSITVADGIENVTWTQPVAVKFSAGKCILNRESVSDAVCNVQIVSLNGQVLASAKWEPNTTSITIPVSAPEGSLLIVSVVNEASGLRTAKRVMVK